LNQKIPRVFVGICFYMAALILIYVMQKFVALVVPIFVIWVSLIKKADTRFTLII